MGTSSVKKEDVAARIDRLSKVLGLQLSVTWEHGQARVWVQDRLVRRVFSPQLPPVALEGWLDGFSDGFAYGFRAGFKRLELNLKSGSLSKGSLHDNTSG